MNIENFTKRIAFPAIILGVFWIADPLHSQVPIVPQTAPPKKSNPTVPSASTSKAMRIQKKPSFPWNAFIQENNRKSTIQAAKPKITLPLLLPKIGSKTAVPVKPQTKPQAVVQARPLPPIKPDNREKTPTIVAVKPQTKPQAVVQARPLPPIKPDNREKTQTIGAAKPQTKPQAVVQARPLPPIKPDN
ncbi:MAG: hypothetical protein VX438_13355, partial [Planctomycetota bacterium]|nr:hypothetical protein [Planctomycetota bacterium]